MCLCNTYENQLLEDILSHQVDIPLADIRSVSTVVQFPVPFLRADVGSKALETGLGAKWQPTSMGGVFRFNETSRIKAPRGSPGWTYHDVSHLLVRRMLYLTSMAGSSSEGSSEERRCERVSHFILHHIILRYSPEVDIKTIPVASEAGGVRD